MQRKWIKVRGEADKKNRMKREEERDLEKTG